MSDALTFRFSLPIWRISFDAFPSAATQPVLVLELRDKTTVEWCAVNVETGSVIWQHAFPTTGWWTSLVGFYAGKLVMHTYSGTEQPAPRYLMAVDALTGAVSWSLSEYKFDYTDGLVVQLSRITPAHVSELSYLLLADGSRTSLSPAPNTLPMPVWQFPIPYEASNPYYSVIRQFIQKVTNNIPQKAINYGEIAGHLLFFNYLYPANAITLSRSILVVNSTKTILLHETIDSDFGIANFGECLYSDHHIVYLKKTDELVVLKLPRT